MKDAKIVVTMEVPTTETWGMNGEQTAKYLLRAVRYKAQRTAEEQGGRLVPTSMPEVDIKKGTHALLGTECWLVYTVWQAEAPEKVQLDTGRPA